MILRAAKASPPPHLTYLLALLALYMKAWKKMLENKQEHFVADSYDCRKCMMVFFCFFAAASSDALVSKINTSVDSTVQIILVPTGTDVSSRDLFQYHVM